MEKKAAVVGSGGQLGVELMHELRRRGYQPTGLAHGELDIGNPSQVEEAIASVKPTAVFNAAAFNQVDLAEREPGTAFQANALGVRNLALACQKTGARLVHFSTDYVFDGTLGRPYIETDATHPLGAYAVSKLAGELFAQAYLERALVLRTSGVFGIAGRHTKRGNFLELMLRLASEGKPIRVVEDYVASPTYAPLLASRSIDLLEGDHAGVFHLGGGTAISWFAYAKTIFDAAGVADKLQPGQFQPTRQSEYQTEARRPQYSALENRRLAEVGIAAMPPLEQAIRHYLAHRQ